VAGSGAGLVGGACGWGSGMPAPSGQIPPPWARWENEAPAARAARSSAQAIAVEANGRLGSQLRLPKRQLFGRCSEPLGLDVRQERRWHVRPLPLEKVADGQELYQRVWLAVDRPGKGIHAWRGYDESIAFSTEDGRGPARWPQREVTDHRTREDAALEPTPALSIKPQG
jgi:hypothetical protein